jgi:alpha-tubulin suppressor-like RCC1 family protein
MERHRCGVTTSGKIYCWGNNTYGQLGDGTTLARLAPVAVASSLTFKAVAAGLDFTCGLASDGAAYCWGSGDSLGLGTPGAQNQLSPVAVSGGMTFVSLKAGVGACGLDTNGAAHCWGSAGTEANVRNTPVSAPTPLRGGLVFTAISVGYHHSCGIASNGLAATYCWAHFGWGNNGDLGTGDSEDYWGPVPIAPP